MGLLQPWQGTVNFNGKDVSKLPAYTKAEMGLVLVPEGRQLFTDMTIYENLEMGASNQRARPKFARNLERVYEMFPRLKERSNQKAGTLSGGEQQNVQLALAISDYGYVIVEGRIKLEGPARKLIKDKHVREAYLGL
jgi:branched-chain amino acid transport system ATP-binding protein